MSYNNTYIEQGWQCPICKNVMSPTTGFCLWCRREKEVAASNVSDMKLTTNMSGWRDLPPTDKQLAYIRSFGNCIDCYDFKGTTRGDACDYIDRYSKDVILACELEMLVKNAKWS